MYIQVYTCAHVHVCILEVATIPRCILHVAGPILAHQHAIIAAERPGRHGCEGRAQARGALGTSHAHISCVQCGHAYVQTWRRMLVHTYKCIHCLRAFRDRWTLITLGASAIEFCCLSLPWHVVTTFALVNCSPFRMSPIGFLRQNQKGLVLSFWWFSCALVRLCIYIYTTINGITKHLSNNYGNGAIAQLLPIPLPLELLLHIYLCIPLRLKKRPGAM